MKGSTILLAGVLIVSACAGSDTGVSATSVPGLAGEAGDVGTATGQSEAVADATTTTTTTTLTEPPVAVTTTAAPTTVARPRPTPAPAPAPTPAPTPVPTPAPTAPPTTTLQLALCVGGEINFFTTGRRGEIALYQQTLRNRGYDPGAIDGFFGQNTYSAATQEILDNGNVNGPNGVFEELFPDDGAVLPAAFTRLGIGCIDSFDGDF